MAWWITVMGKRLRLGKNLYAVQAVYSVACLERCWGETSTAKEDRNEPVLSGKTPRLFLPGDPPGIKVRTQWQSSPAVGDKAESIVKGNCRSGDGPVIDGENLLDLKP